MPQTLQAISSDAGDNATSIRKFLQASGVDGTRGLRPCRALSFFSQSDSFRIVMGIDPNSLMVSKEWTTPSGTPLGGWGNLMLDRNGAGGWHLHAHGRSYEVFKVHLRATFTTPAGRVLQCNVSGNTGSQDLEFYPALGESPEAIRSAWTDYRYGRLDIFHEYSLSDDSSSSTDLDPSDRPNPPSDAS